MGRNDISEPMVMEEYQKWRQSFVNLLDTRFHNADWLDRQVLYGQMRLFSGEKYAILVSVKTYPTGAKECHIECAAGELDELIGPAIIRVEQWAKEQGCLVVTIQSREGWCKVMKSQGYDLYQTTIRKEIA